MTINWKRFSGMLLVAALAVGCGDDSDSGDDEGGGGGDSPVDASACADVTYANFGQKFEADYCASCHAASVKGSARMAAPTDDVFDSLAQIKAKKGELKEQVQTKQMPFPTAKSFPTDAERAKFVQWIDCGPN